MMLSVAKCKENVGIRSEKSKETSITIPWIQPGVNETTTNSEVSKFGGKLQLCKEN